MTVAVHWFRKGLRLHDNPALLRAIEGATKVRLPTYLPYHANIVHRLLQVYPVFVIDPHFANSEYVGAIRYNFLLEVHCGKAGASETMQGSHCHP